MEQQAVAEEQSAAYKYKADQQQWGNQQKQDETSQQLHREQLTGTLVQFK